MGYGAVMLPSHWCRMPAVFLIPNYNHMSELPALTGGLLKLQKLNENSEMSSGIVNLKFGKNVNLFGTFKFNYGILSLYN